MRNSDNCIFDYAHSFFVEDFKFKALYWFKVVNGRKEEGMVA